jgi:hypothetical protein
MSKSPTDASTPQISLDGFADPQDARMFGVVMALASEVYILKAEVQRLTSALEQGGHVNGDALQAAGQSEAMAAWLAAEQKAFTAEILRPWLEPDPVADVRHFMSDA